MNLMSALVLLHAARLYDAKLSFYDLIYALFKGLYIEFVILLKKSLSDFSVSFTR